MKTGCLGPEGSYSQQAAIVLGEKSEIVLYKNFPSVVKALKSGEVDQAVLPIENTIQGGVLQNMDLLAEESDLFAVKEYVMPIDHRLVTLKGTTMSEIERVYSHMQALGQCSEFLVENLPFAKQIPTESTAHGLAMVKEKGDACIIGYHLCKELTGYEISPATIANEKNNFTYFELVKRGEENLPEHSKNIYFVAKLPHKPGTLYSLLSIINDFGLNMTKIESRPIKDKVGEYRFFIEVEGDRANENVKNAFKKLKSVCQDFKLLGAY